MKKEMASAIISLTLFIGALPIAAVALITPVATITADNANLTVGQSTTIRANFDAGPGGTMTTTDINMLQPGQTQEINAIMVGDLRSSKMQNPLNYVFTATTAGTFMFRAYGVSTNSPYPYWGYSSQIAVMVNPPAAPTVSISSSLGSTMTAGQTSTIRIVGTAGTGDSITTTGTWATPPAALGARYKPAADTLSPTLIYAFTPTVAGTYTVDGYAYSKYYQAWWGGSGAAEIVIQVNPAPISVGISTDKTTMTVGQSTMIRGTYSSDVSDPFTTTDINETDPAATSEINAIMTGDQRGTTVQNPLNYTFYPIAPGTYTFRAYGLTKTHTYPGWQYSAPISITVNPASDMSGAGNVYTWPNFASIFSNGKKFNLEFSEASGTASYGSTPDLGDFMIARVLNVGSYSAGGGFSLTAVHMNWNDQPTPSAQYLYKVLDTTSGISVENGVYLINTAYDASIAPYKGQYWVSFECYGPKGFSGSSATCIGPLAWNNATGKAYIDPTHISVVVKDFYVTGQKFEHSAAEPKLLLFNGKLYVYWEVTTIDTTPGADYLGWANDGSFVKAFAKLDARGAQVELDSATGLMRVVGASGQAISAIDPVLSKEVIQNADIFQLIPYNGGILAVGALAPQVSATKDCGSPLGTLPWTKDPIPNCYRMYFAQANDPFGPFVFASETGIPTNATQYYRFVYRPSDGKTILKGGVTSPLIYWDVNSDDTAYFYQWPDLLLKPVCDPVKQPFPTYIDSNGTCVSASKTSLDELQSRIVQLANILSALKSLVGF